MPLFSDFDFFFLNCHVKKSHFPFIFRCKSIEVIIADDSPKSSIKTQSVNGGNNGNTVAKPNEPSSTTTGDSVNNFVNEKLFSLMFREDRKMKKKSHFPFQ